MKRKLSFMYYAFIFHMVKKRPNVTGFLSETTKPLHAGKMIEMFIPTEKLIYRLRIGLLGLL